MECGGGCVVGEGGELGEGVAGEGCGVGGDEVVAGCGEVFDGGEAGLRPIGLGPSFEVLQRDFGVVADVEDGE